MLVCVCMGAWMSAYAEERKYLLLNENPVSPLRNVDSGAGECLVRIKEDREVALTMANGNVAHGWLRRGTPVVVNKDGVAQWVYSCGNGIVEPIGWKPEGPTECFSGRESSSCTTEKLVPAPTATPRAAVTPRRRRTPAPRATPTPTPVPQKEVVRVAQNDEQPLSTSPRMIVEEKKVVTESSSVPGEGENGRVVNQSVSLFIEVRDGSEYRPQERPQYIPREPKPAMPPKKQKKERRTVWVVGGVLLGVVAVGAAVTLSDRDGGHGKKEGGGGGGGPAPEPPNG